MIRQGFIPPPSTSAGPRAVGEMHLGPRRPAETWGTDCLGHRMIGKGKGPDWWIWKTSQYFADSHSNRVGMNSCCCCNNRNQGSCLYKAVQTPGRMWMCVMWCLKQFFLDWWSCLGNMEQMGPTWALYTIHSWSGPSMASLPFLAEASIELPNQSFKIRSTLEQWGLKLWTSVYWGVVEELDACGEVLDKGTLANTDLSSWRQIT